jgi:2-polyprenyl-3-methyl-5-hydroxy-6-metoxy-1,4-benzoquinol methylase
MLPDLVKPIAAGEADVVLGSRFLAPKGAIKGGMPYYKFIGNRILTHYQNWILGSKLSEFHTGYKAYTVDALRRIPFELNSNLFHFDTEIIIQLLRARCRFAQVAIPTHYGDEICRVPGMKYAKDVVIASTVARLQDYALVYRRNFDVDHPDGPARYESKVGFPSPHSIALDLIPSDSTVLDLGCGPGHLCAPLHAKGARVIGVDQNRSANAEQFDEFYTAEFSDGKLPRRLDDVDFILVLDVLEHLPEPETFCATLREQAQSNPNLRIVISTGNVGYFVTRFMLLFGHFNYGKRGILDLTHTRLFTFASLRRLLGECGYIVEREFPVPAPIPLVVHSKSRQRRLMAIQRLLMKVSRRLFAYQCVMVARPLPTVGALLERTITSSRDQASAQQLRAAAKLSAV